MYYHSLRTYEALNAQLLEELPQFSSRVAGVAARLLHVFLGLQATWHQNVLGILSNGTTPISDTSFISAHAQALASVCQQLSVLHIVPVSLSVSFSRHRPAGESATPPISSRREQYFPASARDLRKLAASNRNSRSLDDLDKVLFLPLSVRMSCLFLFVTLSLSLLISTFLPLSHVR